MSFFGNYGTTAAEVNENPFGLSKRASYPVALSTEVKAFKEDGPEYFVITYEITSGPEEGKNASRMFRLNPVTAADASDYEVQNARTLSNFKAALLELGFTADQINAFDPRVHGNKINGIKGTAILGPQKGNPQYNSVFGFERNSAPVSAQPQTVTPPVSEGNVADLLGADW